MSVCSVLVLLSFIFKLSQRAECAGHLNGPAQKRNAGQHRHVDEFAGVIADGQTKQNVVALNWRCDGSPIP